MSNQEGEIKQGQQAGLFKVMARYYTDTTSYIFGMLKQLCSQIAKLALSSGKKYSPDDICGRCGSICTPGSIDQVAADAASFQKPMFVYISDVKNTPNASYKRDLFGNDSVFDMLGSQFTMWAGDVSSPRGEKVALHFKAKTYPYFVIADSKNTTLTPLMCLEGHQTLETLVNFLIDGVDRYRNGCQGSSYEQSRKLRNEQDEAYNESVRKDMERKKQREEQKELERQKSLKKKEQEEEVNRQRQDAYSYFTSVERASDMSSCSTHHVTRISLRLPDGKKVESNFKRSDQLKLVHQWAMALPLLMPADGHKIPLYFTLKVPLNKSAISNMEQTLEEQGLIPSAALCLDAVPA